jgi:hypothetical protein
MKIFQGFCVENDFNGAVSTVHTKSSTELKVTTSGGLSGSVRATSSSDGAKDSSLSCESASLSEICSELPIFQSNYLQTHYILLLLSSIEIVSDSSETSFKSGI